MWSYERFKQGTTLEVGSISSGNALSGEMLDCISRGLKVLMMLGSLDLPVAKADSGYEEPCDWFQAIVLLSLVWTGGSAVAVLLWIMQRVKTWWAKRQAEDHERKEPQETRDTSGGGKPREGGSPMNARPTSPESSIESLESWREYVRDSIDPKLTSSEWETWMDGLGYVLVRKESRVLKEVTVCQYGRVAHTCTECRFLRNSNPRNRRVFPICGECQGLAPSGQTDDRGDGATATAKGGASILM